MIDFWIEAFQLKDVKRSGWLLRGISPSESVADHSWGTALLCLRYASEANVNLERALAIALVHDLAEAKTGDFASRINEADRDVSTEQKAKLELSAMESFQQLLDEEQLFGLWQEYEDAVTAEALFVRDMNLLDMCVQALIYEQEGRYDRKDGLDPAPFDTRLDEFFVSADARLRTPVGKRVFQEIKARFEVVKAAHALS